jgi:hypothetical protein
MRSKSGFLKRRGLTPEWAELIPVTLLEAIPSGKEFLDTPGALTFFREVAIFAPIP